MKCKILTSVLLITGFGLSQSDYFPLEIGNYWTYERMYTALELYQNEVIDTTIINGNKYYKVYSSLNNYSKYYRVDSLQKLYKYNFSLSDDELIADFQMEVGDSILIGVFGDSIETYLYLTGSNRTVITATDTFYNCYSFYYDSQEVYDDEMSAFYAPNLGLVLSVMEGPVPLFQTLIGAHIGGVDVLVTTNQANKPQSYNLSQNYPNPFNPVTTIQYDLPEQANVNIIIYDMLGREVKTLMSQTQDAGFKSVIWNATNDHGKPVSAGVYFYQIRAGEFVQTRKMVLLR